MYHKKSKVKHIKRFFKIALRIVAGLFIFLALLSILLSFPKVQTLLAKELSGYVNKKFNTDIGIEKVDMSYAGQVLLKNIAIKDPQRDTIIAVKELKTSILNFKKLYNGKPQFGKITVSDVLVLIKTYKGKTEDALKQFVQKIEGDRPPNPTSNFMLTSEKVILKNARFKVIDLNKQEKPIIFYKDIDARIDDFKIIGPDVHLKIKDLGFIYQNDLKIENLQTDFIFTKTGMKFLNTHLETAHSAIAANINMTYKESELSEFKDKVYINAEIPQADIALQDLQRFYREFGTNDMLRFSAKITGTLNDFSVKKLRLNANRNSRIDSDLQIKNFFSNKNGFQLIADIHRLESDYYHLKELLPNALGKTLPSIFKDFGHFRLSGHSLITNQRVSAKLNTQSAVGNFKTDLIIDNIEQIDRANYEGVVSIRDLKLGQLINDPLIGEFSMDADVKGRGFTLKHLDTQIRGKVLKHQYKGYTYSDILVNGKVKDKLFLGNMTLDDPNIKLDFQGLADLSKKKYRFNFTSHVNFANFSKLNLLKKNGTSVLKGDIKMAMTGNKLENMAGNIQIKNAVYQNEIQEYRFKDFNITSAVKKDIQTLKISSSDIINGRMRGKFLFNELTKLGLNALGSIYTNYRPYEVTPHQHLDFRFTLYNHAITALFPKAEFGKNTSIKGEINSDKNLFKLTFKSPEVGIYDNLMKTVKLQINNQNPLFNTQLSIAKGHLKYYDIADFNLVNVTLNDSLRFRTEFKGGNQLKDQFNLAFYHTIDDKNHSVLGFQKSDIIMKGNLWYLNPNNNTENKIIYDNTRKRIDYKMFTLTSKEQQLSFYGEQEGNHYTNFNLDMDRLNLAEIVPDIKNFELKGLVNGGVWIEKKNEMLIPTVDVQIIDLFINDKLQGDLVGEIKGADSNLEYLVDLSLEKKDVTKMLAKGKIDMQPKNHTIDMGITFDEYDISILNALARGVMEEVRGNVSGKVNMTGLLKNPIFSGDLTMNRTEMYFPYINVNYALEDKTKLVLKDQSLIIEDTGIYDTLHKTYGSLSGIITHRNFEKWLLDIAVKTDNLLAINTVETETSPFYGTGYLSGNANFSGNINNINIEINGSSNPGTFFVIPVSHVKTIGSSKLIHFKKPPTDDTTSLKNLKKQLSERFKGIVMDFNLDVTKDAEIEIVIDKNTGSVLQGNGKGTIQMNIDTKGSFNMYGNYVIDQGFYNFKYGGIINKPFVVKEGGTISFSGNPYKAELDIEAAYTTKANPKILLSEYSSNRDVPVELITKITGELFNSEQEFDIVIPNAPISLSSELNLVLQTDKGNMMRQFVYLLIFGNFLKPENILNNSLQNIGNRGITNLATAVSNMLLGIFSDPKDKIQFGVDYTQGYQSVDNLYNTENQLGLKVATRLGKKEQIVINGEVKVPTGNQSNANIAGNVSIELPLNKRETLHLKGFSRQNEIQYTEEEEGYTQGIGLSWQVDFDNGKEFLEKLGLKKSEAKKQEKNPNKQLDSIPKKNDLLHFK